MKPPHRRPGPSAGAAPWPARSRSGSDGTGATASSARHRPIRDPACRGHSALLGGRASWASCTASLTASFTACLTTCFIVSLTSLSCSTSSPAFDDRLPHRLLHGGGERLQFLREDLDRLGDLPRRTAAGAAASAGASAASRRRRRALGARPRPVGLERVDQLSSRPSGPGREADFAARVQFGRAQALAARRRPGAGRG